MYRSVWPSSSDVMSQPQFSSSTDKLAAAALVDLAEVFRGHFVERPVDYHILTRGRLPHHGRHVGGSFRGLEVEQGIRLALAKTVVGAVDGDKALADGLAST